MSFCKKLMLASGNVVLLLSIQSVNAKNLSLPEIGVSIEVPDDWKAVVQRGNGRTNAFLKPGADKDEQNVLRCRIDRHDLPGKFHQYTQERINTLYEQKPLTAKDFATQLTQYGGVPVSVTESGLAMLGSSRANWAISSATETVSTTTAYYMTKTYLSQTPRYAWNVQCGSASTVSASESSKTFRSGAPIFERLFSTFQYIEK
jgi:hypothetical protein